MSDPGVTADDVALRLASLARRAAVAYDRPDLEARLDHLIRVASEPAVAVLIVGDFKQGKSSLLNALVGQDICPTEDDSSIDVPVNVRFGEVAGAALVGRAETPEGGIDNQVDSASPVQPSDATVPLLQPIAIGEIAARLRDPEGASAVAVDVVTPSPALARGLALIEVPAIGGFGSLNLVNLYALAPHAEVAVFVHDAGQELGAHELAVLSQLDAQGLSVVVARTRTDIHHSWREMMALDAEHLKAAGLEIHQVAVSAVLRRLALDRRDRALNRESRIGDLAGWIERRARGRRVGSTSLIREVIEVNEVLAAQFTAEREAWLDPDRSSALVARLETAQAAANELRASASAWQRRLTDGFADMQSDVDHDLRERLRNLNRETGERIDECDPATEWDTIKAWVEQATAEQLAEHFALIERRVRGVVTDVVEVFGAQAGGIDDGFTFDAIAIDGGLIEPELSGPDLTVVGLPAQALTLLRSSYGSAAMLGFFGSMAGLAVVAPVALVAGALLGAKGMRGEREKQVAQRRSQAKSVVSRLNEQVSFAAGKHSRDVARMAQRSARDFLTERAAMLDQSATSALEAARAARSGHDQERGERLAVIDTELSRLAELRRRAVDALEAADGPGGASA